MIETLILMLTPLALGAALAWRLSSQPQRRGWHLAAGLAALPLMVLALFPIAQVLGSDALGWIAGLSLMLLAVLALPLAAGLAIGWFWARRRGRPSPPVDAGPVPSASRMPAPPPPPIDLLEEAAWAERRVARRGMLTAVAGVGAGFWVVIGAGFRLHDQPAPPPLDAGLWPAVVVLVVTLSLGVRWLWRRRAAGTMRRVSPRAHGIRGAGSERWEGGGITWSGAAADAAACCTHLAAVETAMRAAGIDVRPHGPGSARAACLVDLSALTLPAGIVAEQLVIQERSPCDGHVSRLRCTSCGSQLWVLDPTEAPRGAAWFPGPPGTARP